MKTSENTTEMNTMNFEKKSTLDVNVRGMVDGHFLDMEMSIPQQVKELVDNCIDVFKKQGIQTNKCIIKITIEPNCLVVSMNGKGICAYLARKAQTMMNLHRNDQGQNGKYGFGLAVVRTQLTKNKGTTTWVSCCIQLTETEKSLIKEKRLADISSKKFSLCEVDMSTLEINTDNELNYKGREIWNKYALNNTEQGTVQHFQTPPNISKKFIELLNINNPNQNLYAYLHQTYAEVVKNGLTLIVNNINIKAQPDISKKPWLYIAKTTIYDYKLPQGAIDWIKNDKKTEPHWIGNYIIKDDKGENYIPTFGRQKSGKKLSKKIMKKFNIKLDNIEPNFNLTTEYIKKHGGVVPWEGTRGILTDNEIREIYKSYNITLPEKHEGSFGRHFYGLFLNRCNIITRIQGPIYENPPAHNEHLYGPILNAKHTIKHTQDNDVNDKSIGIQSKKGELKKTGIEQDKQNVILISMIINKNNICSEANLKKENEQRKEEIERLKEQQLLKELDAIKTAAKSLEEQSEQEEVGEEDDVDEEEDVGEEEYVGEEEDVDEEDVGEEEDVDEEDVGEEEYVGEEEEEKTTGAIQLTIIDNLENDAPNFERTTVNIPEVVRSLPTGRTAIVNALKELRDRPNTTDDIDGIIRGDVRTAISEMLRKITSSANANTMLQYSFGMVYNIDLTKSIDMLIGFYTNEYGENEGVKCGTVIKNLYDNVMPKIRELN